MTLAFFYCKHNDNQKNSFVAILRGLLSQLAQQNEDLLAYIYERCASSNEVTLESPNQLKDLVELSLKSCENVYIVIDGLDECEEAEEKKTAIWSRSVVAAGKNDVAKRLHLLFVSQRDGILDSILTNVSILVCTSPPQNYPTERLRESSPAYFRENYSDFSRVCSEHAALSSRVVYLRNSG